MEKSDSSDPNLDIRTIHVLRTKEFPTGHSEAVIYPQTRSPQSDERDKRTASSANSSSWSRLEKRERADRNKDRSVRRSKSNFRRHCLNLQVDRIITLTTRENIKDRGKFHRLVKKWLRLCKNDLPELAGVAVFERQKRGAFHLHLAVRGHYDVKLLRKHWIHVCDSGSVNIAFRRGRISKLIGYLSKYLTKGMSETNRYVHRYLRTGYIPAAREREYRGSLEELRDIFHAAYGEPQFVFNGGDWSWLWVEPD